MAAIDVASNTAMLNLNAKMDVQNLLLAQIVEKSKSSQITDWATLKILIESGAASKIIAVGDQFDVDRLTSNSVTSVTNPDASPGITSASISDSDKFFNTVGAGEQYQIVFNGNSWICDGKIIRLSECGITTAGTAKVNDCINVSQTLTKVTFDVIGINQATPTDVTKTNSVTLMTHSINTNAVFDAAEAFYANTTGAAISLTGGAVKFTVQTNPDYAADNGKTFYVEFTNGGTPLTSIPAGARIHRDGSHNVSWSGRTATLFDSTGINSAAHKLGTGIISETAIAGAVDLTANLSDLTAPGTTATGINNHFLQSSAGKLNSVRRCSLGNGNYKESYVRQLINSSLSSGDNWWSSKNDWDISPTSFPNGWMYRLDPDFLNVLGNVKLTCIKNSVCEWVSGSSDSRTYEINSDKFYLLSRDEAFGGREVSGYPQNSPYSYFSEFSDNTAASADADSNRIKYNLSNTATTYWLRSCHASYAHDPRYIHYLDGRVSYHGAFNTYGVAPACTIL